MDEGSRACRKCGASLAPGARFCASCGANQDEAPARSPGILYGLVAGIGVIAILLIFLLFRQPQPSVVKAAGPQPGLPVVLAPPRPFSPGPPLIRYPSPRPPPVDPNRQAVAAYLAKVARIEAQRKQVVNNLGPALLSLAVAKMGAAEMKQLEPLLRGDPEAPPRSQPAAPIPGDPAVTINSYVDGLRQALIQLQRLTPPVPAQRFQNAYVAASSSYIGAMLQVRQAIETNNLNIQQEQGQLDQQTTQPLNAADQELGNLTARYHLMKTFAISDSGGGSVLQGDEGVPSGPPLQ